MYLLALALTVDPAAGGPVESIAQTFGVDWPHLIAQVISFSIVCALLYRLAYQPILRMLATRREQIALGKANAEKIDAALAAIESQRRDILTQARGEATHIVDDARDSARRLREQEAQAAALAAERVAAAARQAAALEHDRMLAELKGEVGRLVVDTTSVVLGKVLTPEDQRKLNEETAARFAAA